MRRRLVATACGLLLPCAVVAADDASSTRPLRIVVPFAAGGNADLIARWLALRLEPAMARPVIVENRAGAGGNLALDFVARSAPDGSTWLLGTSTLATNPVFVRMPADPMVDLVPVMGLAQHPMVVFARKDLPAQGPMELLALLRASAAPLSCGATGGGTRLGCELLRQQSGGSLVVVEYRGSSQAMSDLAAGHVDLAVDIGHAGRALVGAGKIKTLARAGAPGGDGLQLPDVLPGFDIQGWTGLFAPTGTSAARLERMRDALQRVLTEPATRERWQEMGAKVPADPSAAGLAQRLRWDTERYRDIARAAGMPAP